MTVATKDSILDSVKQVLGVEADDTAFDIDIMMHINTVFATLTQLGVGDPTGFEIIDNTTIWDDYIQGNKLLNGVKTYIYKKVRIFFDPPGERFVIQALTDEIKEFEWRIMVTVDPLPEGAI